MTKKHFFYGLTIGVCALSIYSCSKSDTGLISENHLKHTIEGNNLKNGSNLQSIVTPTRKAKQYTITDPETGQVQIFYDCREAGSTCDVGENPPPPPPTNGKTTMITGEIRNAIISDAYNKDSKTILQIFKTKKDQLAEIFPKVYEENIQSGINSGQLKFTTKESYLAIVENSIQQTPVYVYLTQNNSQQNKIEPVDSTKNKVAKINTETGVVECKEAGSNCATRFANNFNVSHSNYLQLIDNEFKNMNLAEAVLSKAYTVYETKKYIQLKPTNGVGNNFYVLK